MLIVRLPTRICYLSLLLIIVIFASLFTHQALAADTLKTFSQKKPSRLQPIKKGPGKLQPVTTSKKKIQPLGFCCNQGQFFSSTEANCRKSRGSYFPTEREAKIKCTGFCCKDGEISKSTVNTCKEKRGTFYRTDREAEQRCEGYCSADFKVTKATELKCTSVKGKYFTNKQHADRFCSKQKGFCCIDGKTRQLTKRECQAKRGKFYQFKRIANKACKQKAGYCNVRGKTQRLSEDQCNRKKGQFFISERFAIKGLLKTRKQALAQKKSIKKLKPVQLTVKKRLGPNAPNYEFSSSKKEYFTKDLKPTTKGLKLAKKDLITKKGLAELSIQDFHIVDTNLMNGQRFEYVLSVKNNGGTPNNDEMYFRFESTLWTSNHSSVKVPAAGQTLVYKGTIKNNTTICGPLTFTVTVDAGNDVNESNENNNTAKEHVMVMPLSDLGLIQPNGPFISPTSVGKVNTNIPLDIKVYNNGCIATKPNRIWVGCDEQWPTPGDIPAISPGKHWSFSPSFKWKTTGVRKCIITLDSENVLQEAFEGNNKKEGQITVTD